jgi:hypothetical protein
VNLSLYHKTNIVVSNSVLIWPVVRRFPRRTVNRETSFRDDTFVKIMSSNGLIGRALAFVLLLIVLGTSFLTFSSPSLGAQNAAANLVDFRLVPDRTSINPGEQFSVAIQIEPNGQPVAGVQAFIDFDASFLQVTELSVDAGSPLSIPLLSNFDNVNGEIDIAAGTFAPGPPDTTFVMANITFVADIEHTVTNLSFSSEAPRQSIASIASDEVLRELIGVEIVIGNPSSTPTPSPTPTTSPTPSPLPTATPTNTPPPASPTPTPNTPTPTQTPAPTPTSSPVSTPTPTPILTPLPSKIVDIKLVSESETVIGGNEFNVSIVVEPNGQEVTGVEAFLIFDPAHVTVQKITIDPSSPLNQEVSISTSIEAGLILIAAGILGPRPDSAFTMANIEFKALNLAGVSEFTLSNDPTQKTMASFGGFEIQRTLSGTSVTIITPPPTPLSPKPLVDLELNLEVAGTDSWVATSSLFDLTILVSTNEQPVSGIQTFINFDPTKISVVSVEILQDSPIYLNLRTEFDNDAGEVIIAAGTLGDPATQPFSLAVITFLSASEPSLTHIGFSTSTPRSTIASVDGIEVQRDTTGVTVRVGPHSDLRITKLATPLTVRAGENLTYILNVQNIGPETALAWMSQMG